MGKLIITPLAGGILTAFHDGGRLCQLDWNKMDEEPRCGDIYRAKISSVNRNIQAAFAGLGGQNGYLQLGENDKIKTGDELTLQVSKEAVKTKLPVMTRQLSFPGKYLVFLPGGRGLHLSHKLEQNAVPEQLTKALLALSENCGIILRTNAAQAEPEEILREAGRLQKLTEEITVRAAHSVCPARLYRDDEPWLASLRDRNAAEIEEILTDDKVLYEKAEGWLRMRQPEDLKKLRFYADQQLSLNALYSLEKALEKALEKRVWLKSGGYLVIEPTEAMTVIDVNTGKNEGHKSFEETIFQTNLEAAEEIAVQLCLRGISGSIIIDFINMREEEHRKMLLERLESCVRTDPVHTEVLDMTKLGLVEMTREKRTAPLARKLAAAGL